MIGTCQRHCRRSPLYKCIKRFCSTSENKILKLGDVSVKLKPPQNSELVPYGYVHDTSRLPQSLLTHLRWLFQKDQLKQDVFLIGLPGTTRRRLVMKYLEITQKEYEYLALTRDITEADIKQRREIKGGSAFYVDQAAVRAALEGRVLILDGIEKAERNVLPILNNLLENREVQLDDGRFLVAPEKYDKLLLDHSEEELKSFRLVRVAEDFRVIALGLPIPKFRGHTLDPPLRSRFQSRHITYLPFNEHYQALAQMAPNVPTNRLAEFVSFAYGMLTDETIGMGVPEFPVDNLKLAAYMWNSYPNMSPRDLIERLYPYLLMLKKDGQDIVKNAIETFGISDVNAKKKTGTSSVQQVNFDKSTETVRIELLHDGSTVNLLAPFGSASAASIPSDVYIPAQYHERIISEMLMSHSVHDFCLIGPKGCGKSKLVNRFAELLQYEITPVMLYQDMTSRDLVQQRRMLPNGDTVWQHAPLVDAALTGCLAVLDGIHRVHHSTLNILQRLVHDREIELFDGTRLMHKDRFDVMKEKSKLSDEQLKEKKILPIHPSFRIIGLAEPPNLSDSSQQWLTAELLTTFLYHHLKPLKFKEEMDVVTGTLNSLAGSLSTRQLLRIMKRLTAYPEESLNTAVNKVCLSRFLPNLTRISLNQALEASGMKAESSNEEKAQPINYGIVDGVLVIGKTTARVFQPENRTLVPDILFYDNFEHLRIIEDMIRDFNLGEHLLLVGNQGVGKNKVADRFLQLLNLPRQYIQLHRDTTVQTLTLQATMRDGVLLYEDSPLVKAVKNGHILVIDEGDKAPTHVTCILKSLLESQRMFLADGRKIVPPNTVGELDDKIIKMHENFRVIVLANRPGFPFLGNDFYAALGDMFACHTVDNPNRESELAMLRKYGPDVPEETLNKLSSAFTELRKFSDDGLLNYPYSTRELVNIVRHLQSFPDEPLTNVVRNVFDFDTFLNDAQETIVNVLNKNGIPFGKTSKYEICLSPKFPLPAATFIGSWGFRENSNVSSIDFNFQPMEMNNPLPFSPRNFDLDRMDVRSERFSEEISFWQLPLNDVNIVSDVAASNTGDIFVATVNPICLYRINPVMKLGSCIEFYYDFFPTTKGYFKPRVKLASLKSEEFEDAVVLHEEMTNILLLIDNRRRAINVLGTGISIYQKIIDKVAPKNVYSGDSYFRMLPEMAKENGIVAIYNKNGSTIDLKNFADLTCATVTFPFNIDECLWTGPSNFLIKSTDNRFYALRLDEEQRNIGRLREISGPNRILNLRLTSTASTNERLIEQAISQRYLAPNRIIMESGDTSYGMLSLGFPETEAAGDLFDFSKADEPLLGTGQPYWASEAASKFVHPSSQFCTLPQIGQRIKAMPYWKIPAKCATKDVNLAQIAGFMEVVDFPNREVFYLPVPGAKYVSPYSSWLGSLMETTFVLSRHGSEGLVTADASGGIRLWETSLASLKNSEAAWRKMIGVESEELKLTVEKEDGDLSKLDEPKHGITDPTGAPHVGGSMFAGGVGGYNTAGLGGVGGPYRLDLGHQVHQLPETMKDQVPEHIRQKAREMAKRAHKQRLKEIQMSEFEAELYEKFHRKVERQIARLRVIIDSLQAKSKERQWIRHQTSGDLDEGKLIEGITGEKSVYRKRAEKEPEPGSPQQKPKWLRICPDVSGSMYRFNGYDGRLERSMEACLMVMESLDGYDQKIKYEIVGHSGEEMDVMFVNGDKPPKNSKDRLNVLKTMLAHSQFCVSGDFTLEAAKLAVKQMAAKDADEKFVVILSDANLDRYGIRPAHLAEIMTSDETVNVFAIFIGSLGDQASSLKKRLPAGKAFVCKNTEEIPQIMQQIFTSTIATQSS